MSHNLTSTEIMLNGLKGETLDYLTANFLIKKMPKRGRSVFSKSPFEKGQFIMEYKGTCKKYSETEFVSLQKLYERNGELSYCLEFYFENEKYYIDATREYEYGFSRLINHARNPTVKLFKPLQVNVGEHPRVAMYAATKIEVGDELFWDYFCKLNPIKCLLDSEVKTMKSVTPDLKWMFCRRTKTGSLVYNFPKKDTSERDGLCVLCFSYKKKLSNHLIKFHKIACTNKRRELIKKGRESNASKFINNQTSSKHERRSLPCPVCNRNYKQLSVHLLWMHPSLNKSEIVKKSKEITFAEEVDRRKEKYLKQEHKNVQLTS